VCSVLYNKMHPEVGGGNLRYFLRVVGIGMFRKCYKLEISVPGGAPQIMG
jgi:hypothetical protein